MSSLSGKASTYKNQILKILSKTSKDIQASFHLNISNGLTVNCRSGELENIENQGLENEIHVVYEGNTYGQNFYITMSQVFEEATSLPTIYTHSYEEMNADFISDFRNQGAGGKSIVMIDSNVDDIGFFMDEVLGGDGRYSQGGKSSATSQG